MTADEIAAKIDRLDGNLNRRFDALDSKVDALSLTVATHSQTLTQHDRENKGFKDAFARLSDRVAKVEKWMWFTLGAGGAAGAGLAKLLS